MRPLLVSLRIGCVGAAHRDCGGCVPLLLGFPKSSVVLLFLVWSLGFYWVRDQIVRCPYLGCCSGVVSGSVVLGQGRGQVAVGIVGRTVGGTSPVEKSILVPASGGVEHAVDRVW